MPIWLCHPYHKAEFNVINQFNIARNPALGAIFTAVKCISVVDNASFDDHERPKLRHLSSKWLGPSSPPFSFLFLHCSIMDLLESNASVTTAQVPTSEPTTTPRGRSRASQIKTWQVTNKPLISTFEKKDYQAECHITDPLEWDELELSVIFVTRLF
jgi:hypothetical protein